MVLVGSKMSISNRIKDFYKAMGKLKEMVVPNSFRKAREKIKPELYKYLNTRSVQMYYKQGSEYVKRWRGKLLWAVDGSMINLPDSEETKAFYSIQSNQTKKERVQALISVLYDVLNEVTINAEIGEKQAENKFVFDNHGLEYSTEAVVLYDRLYADYKVINFHNSSEVDFVIRCPISNRFPQVDKFLASKKVDQIIDLKIPKNLEKSAQEKNIKRSIKVRLVKVILSTGEVEILITSLLNRKKYSLKNFQWLYHQRWGIETYFDRLKNLLEVERFSSGSSQFIEQDFFASIFTSSIESIICKEDEAKMQQDHLEKGTKYCYKVNKAVSYSEIGETLVHLLLDSNKSAEEVFDELQSIFRVSPCPIRPDRVSSRYKMTEADRLRVAKYAKKTFT